VTPSVPGCWSDLAASIVLYLLTYTIWKSLLGLAFLWRKLRYLQDWLIPSSISNHFHISYSNAHKLVRYFFVTKQILLNLLSAGNWSWPKWCDLVLKQEPLLAPPGQWTYGFARCYWKQRAAARLAKGLLSAWGRSDVTGGGTEDPVAYFIKWCRLFLIFHSWCFAHQDYGGACEALLDGLKLDPENAEMERALRYPSYPFCVGNVLFWLVLCAYFRTGILQLLTRNLVSAIIFVSSRSAPRTIFAPLNERFPPFDHIVVMHLCLHHYPTLIDCDWCAGKLWNLWRQLKAPGQDELARAEDR
jgi:hypothetical protein